MDKLPAVFFLLLLTFSVSAQQTDSLAIDSNDETFVLTRPDNTAPWRIGIKFGGGISTLLGGEMENASPAYTLNGGIYGRYRFEKKWILQAEVAIALRGSYFNHQYDEYQLMRLYYLEAPLLLCYGLNESRNTNLVAGLQYGWLVSSVMFVNPSFPEKETPSLKKHDLAAVGGLQFYTPFIGFQLLAKYGLLDINNGLIPGVKPYNKGRDIHNLVVEFNFIF